MRLLTLEEYADALIEDGQSEVAASDMKQRLYENGAMRVAWAAATGGRRGHLYKAWDVRIIDTDVPGEQSLKSVTGADGSTLPLGATEIADLTSRDGVIQAFTMPTSPQKVILNNRSIRNRIKFHYLSLASAALAVGDSAATVWAASDNAPEARSGVAHLARLLLGSAQS